jgi:hypothetical protein
LKLEIKGIWILNKKLERKIKDLNDGINLKEKKLDKLRKNKTNKEAELSKQKVSLTTKKNRVIEIWIKLWKIPTEPQKVTATKPQKVTEVEPQKVTVTEPPKVTEVEPKNAIVATKSFVQLLEKPSIIEKWKLILSDWSIITFSQTDYTISLWNKTYGIKNSKDITLFQQILFTQFSFKSIYARDEKPKFIALLRDLKNHWKATLNIKGIITFEEV